MAQHQKRQRGAQLAITVGGLIVLGVLTWSIGIPEVVHHLHQIGWFAPLLFLPSALALACDVKGWACTILYTTHVQPVSLLSLLRIHLASEAITNLTPATYLGGDATRVYLLRSHGVPTATGLASVIAARTALTVSQVVFIVLGFAFFLGHLGWGHQGWWVLGPLLLAGYGFAIWVIRWQRRGLIERVIRTMRYRFPHWPQLHRWEAHASQIDTQLVRLYDENPQAFFASMASYFLGWLLGAAEVFCFFLFIGANASPLDALILEAMVQPFTAAALIIPGALGVKEVGAVALCQLLGLDESAGLTVMVLKRARQALYYLVGVLVLARAGYTVLSPDLHSRDAVA